MRLRTRCKLERNGNGCGSKERSKILTRILNLAKESTKAKIMASIIELHVAQDIIL